MSKFNTTTDAQTFIQNSGVVDWDFQSAEYTNEEIVNELLPSFLYSNADNYMVANEYDEEEFNFNAALRGFIKEQLNQNPSNYSL